MGEAARDEGRKAGPCRSAGRRPSTARGSPVPTREEQAHGDRTCPAHRAGFPEPDFHGEIIAELERLRESDTVRVIDALAVYKDADGEIEAST